MLVGDEHRLDCRWFPREQLRYRVSNQRTGGTSVPGRLQRRNDPAIEHIVNVGILRQGRGDEPAVGRDMADLVVVKVDSASEQLPSALAIDAARRRYGNIGLCSLCEGLGGSHGPT